MKIIKKVIAPVVLCACLSTNAMSAGLLDTARRTNGTANESKTIILEREVSYKTLTSLNYAAATVQIAYLKGLRKLNGWGEGPSVLERNHAVHYTRILLGTGVAAVTGIVAARGTLGSIAKGLVDVGISNVGFFRQVGEKALMMAALGVTATAVGVCTFRLIGSDIETPITPGYSQDELEEMIQNAQVTVQTIEVSEDEASSFLAAPSSFSTQEEKSLFARISDSKFVNALDCDLLD